MVDIGHMGDIRYMDDTYDLIKHCFVVLFSYSSNGSPLWVISESDLPMPLGLCRGHI